MILKYAKKLKNLLTNYINSVIQNCSKKLEKILSYFKSLRLN